MKRGFNVLVENRMHMREAELNARMHLSNSKKNIKGVIFKHWKHMYTNTKRKTKDYMEIVQ